MTQFTIADDSKAALVAGELAENCIPFSFDGNRTFSVNKEYQNETEHTIASTYADVSTILYNEKEN